MSRLYRDSLTMAGGTCGDRSEQSEGITRTHANDCVTESGFAWMSSGAEIFGEQETSRGRELVAKGGALGC